MDEKYIYSYERTSDYCYHNSDVLKNKLNIKNDKELYIAEREFVTYRTAILLENGIKGNFDFEHLKSIHKFLFQDLYDWAGTLRTCNIAKSNIFCLPKHIETYAKEVFDKIAEKNYFIDFNFKNKVEELANLFADINALHPFREGNGRVQREFIRGLARVNGVNLDFAKISEKEMIVASSESTKGDIDKLLIMFKNISSQISKEEQLKYIDEYIRNKTIKEKFNSNNEE